MSGAQLGDLRSLAHAARRVMDDLATLVGSLEKLAGEHEQLRARCERLEREQEEVRQKVEGGRRERDELARALRNARSAHETLLTEGGGAPPAPRPRKVVVVDDAHSELKMMESILSSAGYQVVTYENGDELEGKMVVDQPDLLLLDIVMPNRNGYEILRALKKDERTKHIPVVIVTSRAHESDRMWSKQQGADDYVMKPFTPEQLLKVAQRFLG